MNWTAAYVGAVHGYDAFNDAMRPFPQHTNYVVRVSAVSTKLLDGLQRLAMGEAAGWIVDGKRPTADEMRLVMTEEEYLKWFNGGDK